MSTDIKTGEKMIVFIVNKKEYAISVSEVKSIEKWQQPTRVPGVAPYICGVINLRGVVTPVIDLRVRLGSTDNEITDETRMIIVQVGDIEVGWIVDEANDVITVHQEEVESSTDTAEKEGLSWVTGIIKHDQRLFNIIHAGAVLDKSVQDAPVH
ncbi:chemotaxis protein CheW [Bacillus altitudinis]|uniref:Chemotaxis protein CheW n=1 Tax=Bacillus aerius TaxID=293388 RepID=A0AB39J434_9BACI|nr:MULTISPECIES: chemotaxis protein CheW [Bacillus]AHL71435.1 chemotaxis protein CheW [Bacillus pumilus]EMI13384.1 modulation of activity in response to attractant [Bacillus stratosphericus LAMA 585]KML03444.1 chemotaxis protein CheW [Bacillus stratosphericus]MBW3699559.1 chemotaxis protein CheW [Bacillus aerophilus]MDH8710331.1 purine-binding chemotaxis protein CheW [Micromonospora sp. 1209]CVM88788.1 Coupling protein CheW [Streptococcus pneumoniae]